MATKEYFTFVGLNVGFVEGLFVGSLVTGDSVTILLANTLMTVGSSLGLLVGLGVTGETRSAS